MGMLLGALLGEKFAKLSTGEISQLTAIAAVTYGAMPHADAVVFLHRNREQLIPVVAKSLLRPRIVSLPRGIIDIAFLMSAELLRGS